MLARVKCGLLYLGPGVWLWRRKGRLRPRHPYRVTQPRRATARRHGPILRAAKGGDPGHARRPRRIKSKADPLTRATGRRRQAVDARVVGQVERSGRVQPRGTPVIAEAGFGVVIDGEVGGAGLGDGQASGGKVREGRGSDEECEEDKCAHGGDRGLWDGGANPACQGLLIITNTHV